MNDINFEFHECDFSMKHMYHKDRADKGKSGQPDLTKQGSGRVYGFRKLGLIHSYTIELGYHNANYLNAIINLESHFDSKEFR